MRRECLIEGHAERYIERPPTELYLSKESSNKYKERV